MQRYWSILLRLALQLFAPPAFFLFALAQNLIAVVHLDFFHQWLGGEPAPWDVKDLSNNLAFKRKKPAAPGK